MMGLGAIGAIGTLGLLSPSAGGGLPPTNAVTDSSSATVTDSSAGIVTSLP